jgi:hypothetical protein
MKERLLPILVLLSCVLFITAGPGQQEGGKGEGKKEGKGGGKGEGGGGAPVKPSETPEYLFNVILGRPDTDRITASVIAWQDMKASLSYGERAEALDQQTAPFALKAGEPLNVVMDRLKPDNRYFYRLTYAAPGAGEGSRDEIRTFHTQRAPGSAFTFAIQADSHLDVSTDVRVYGRTLANVLTDQPDFLMDLGDTFMVDKFGPFFSRAESQYRAQRYYFGRIAHSVPIFLTLGNHDGEVGSRLTGAPDSMPLWSIGMRKKYFPNPEPGGIYSGNRIADKDAGLLQDYYAWQWGSGLFVVLDPFWFTTERRAEDNWGMTLGESQYRWLTETLASSKAPFKFIFIHHLVGGLGRDVRGGIKPAPFMEWGGKNADGSEGFAAHRPGWELPLHSLFVKHGVSIVFHGHDHLFAKEELDGIIYQDVPQPGHPSGGTRSAEEYGYTGVILGSSGHLRVKVAPSETSVEYVRATIPGVTKEEAENGTVDHQYTISR